MRIRLSTIWSWLALAIVLIWTLLPLYWFLKNSLLTPDEIARFPPPLYPLDPTPAAFFNIFGFEYEMANGIVRRGSGQANQIIRGLGNSLIVSAVVTLVTLFVVLPLAYVFARLDFPHKNKLLFAILLAVALPPVSTLIPFYAMYVRLGLSGTLIGLIIVTLTITIPFVTWMLIGYFRNLPAVERLARIDGFSRFETFVDPERNPVSIVLIVGAIELTLRSSCRWGGAASRWRRSSPSCSPGTSTPMRCFW